MFQDKHFNEESALMDFIESVKGTSNATIELKEDLFTELFDFATEDITLDECADDTNSLLVNIDEVLSSQDDVVEWKHYLLDKECLLSIFRKHYQESVLCR